MNLKGLDYDYCGYVLRDGETRTLTYLSRNPQGLVPTLELDDGRHLTQSLAIIEWLDETHPEHALLPSDPLGRARVCALAQMIACEIHPANNLRVLLRLKNQFTTDRSGFGFSGYETKLTKAKPCPRGRFSLRFSQRHSPKLQKLARFGEELVPFLGGSFPSSVANFPSWQGYAPSDLPLLQRCQHRPTRCRPTSLRRDEVMTNANKRDLHT